MFPEALIPPPVELTFGFSSSSSFPPAAVTTMYPPWVKLNCTVSSIEASRKLLLTNFLNSNLLPSAATSTTGKVGLENVLGLSWSSVSVGVSLNSVNDIEPPCPNTAYSWVKLSFTFLNASLILSPVPSLPSTPILMFCLPCAILCELRYFLVIFFDSVHVEVYADSAPTCTLCIRVINYKLRLKYICFIIYCAIKQIHVCHRIYN